MGLDVYAQFEAEALCTDLQTEAYPIEVQSQQGQFVFDPSQSEYLLQCTQSVSQVMAYQQRQYGAYSILSADDVKKIVTFDKDHDVKIKFVVQPQTPTMFFNRGANVYVNLAAQRPDDFDRSLDHEYGHIQDSAYLAKKYPELRNYAKTGQITLEDLRKLVDIFFAEARSGLNPKDQQRYDELKTKIFGDVKSYEIEIIKRLIFFLGEGFRYGAEINTKEFRDFFLSDQFLHMKKGKMVPENAYSRGQFDSQTGQKLDLKRTLILARIYEMGIEDEFPLDNEEAENIPLEHIEFFRLYLRGSAKIQEQI